MVEFPHDFLFGAATSAYQVEGNNVNCDWWEWERRTGKEVSGSACRHYELYRQDFDLAKSLNHTCHRLSLEWSRIEPQEGKFSSDEIEHYRQVISALRERGIEPLVTLHHFTNPLWFSQRGGWRNPSLIHYFLRYVRRMSEELASSVKYWITINEPNVYAYHAYLIGAWPPQGKSYTVTKIVTDNLLIAHRQAYQLIHELYAQKNLAPVLVSIAHNVQSFVPCFPTLKNKVFSLLRSFLYNFGIIEDLCGHKSLDFIGVNYYTRSLVDIEGWSRRALLLTPCGHNHSTLSRNTMGWDIYPEGLFDLLLRLKRYRLPVFILENGTCVDDDAVRWQFIRSHLESLHRAMEAGVTVSGYVYWSLLDNFEWDKGFAPRFGLIEVDYRTYQRTVRESAKKFAEVSRTKRLMC